jgi:SAM-dependent methyltransferase
MFFATNPVQNKIVAARRWIRLTNWCEWPQYYDISVQSYTQQEADFVEAVCRKYCPYRARRLLEPACGTGRLIVELAARGYEMIGFDHSNRGMNYLRHRLKRCRLSAKTFEAQMEDFRMKEQVDAGYCTISTFRHLLTEREARRHLNCIARALRPGGVYILGLHLLPSFIDKTGLIRWTEQRGQTKVSATLRVLNIDTRRRTEDFRVDFRVRTAAKQLRLRYEFQYRTYTAKQFRQLLRSVQLLQLCGIYDFRYNLEETAALNDELGYGLFVLRRRRSS